MFVISWINLSYIYHLKGERQTDGQFVDDGDDGE